MSKQIPQENWIKVFDGGIRSGHMTTNLYELMNRVLKDTRNSPIIVLVQETYYKLGTLFPTMEKQQETILAYGHICNQK